MRSMAVIIMAAMLVVPTLSRKTSLKETDEDADDDDVEKSPAVAILFMFVGLAVGEYVILS